MFIPDPEADFLPSRAQGSKRHPIPDPDPQHWCPDRLWLEEEPAMSLGYVGPLFVFVNVQGAQESISPAYVAWRASTSNRVVLLTRQATSVADP